MNNSCSLGSYIALTVTLLMGMIIILPETPLALEAILVWPAYYSQGNIGTRSASSDRCSAAAGGGWIDGGCPANRTFALVAYSYSDYGDLASEFGFNASLPVIRAVYNGIPEVYLAATWNNFIGPGNLLNPLSTSTVVYWSGNDLQGYAPGRNCEDWTRNQISSSADYAYLYGGTEPKFAAAISSIGRPGGYLDGCSLNFVVFCGCHVDNVATRAPTSSPSSTPSVAPSTPAPSSVPTVTPVPAILVWPAYDSQGNIGTRSASSDRCSAAAGGGWIDGGCPANRTFALVAYSYSDYGDLASEFGFNASLPVIRAVYNGIPEVYLAATWSDFIGAGNLLNPLSTSTVVYWSGNDLQGYAPGRNCEDWTRNQISSSADYAYLYGGTEPKFAAAISSIGRPGGYLDGCSLNFVVFCGCHVDNVATRAPTSSPSSTPSVSPSVAPSVAPSSAPSTVPSAAPSRAPVIAPSVAPSQSPTSRDILMVTTTVTPGGCGTTTPVAQPFLKADNTCTPSGFNTAARATCANGVPSVTLFTNDQGTCTSSTNSSFPTSCHSVVGPGPFGGSITMGFGMACQTYAPENLLEVTVYSGNCNSKTDPMVTFMLLNTCLTPPGIPIAGTIANPPGSFLMRDFGTANKVSLRVEMWNSNNQCEGSASLVNTIELDKRDGEAAIGCIGGNPHGFAGISQNSGRRLQGDEGDQELSTEFRIHAVRSDLPLTISGANTLRTCIIVYCAVSIFLATLLI